MLIGEICLYRGSTVEVQSRLKLRLLVRDRLEEGVRQKALVRLESCNRSRDRERVSLAR